MNISKLWPTVVLTGCWFCMCGLSPPLLTAQTNPSARIDYVQPLASQPLASDAAVIWYDDFDGDERQQQYGEKSGTLVSEPALGGQGRSLEMRYEQGQRGTGGRKLFFGDSPAYRGSVVRRGETFEDVYWRIYVRHQPNWTGGGPAKLSRATSLTSANWQQAMISHVWSSGESLTLDPASGVRNGQVVTRSYNDFPQLRWLGNRPASHFPIHSTREAGRWVCVEARAKLNTPGKKDGLNQLWIDGRLEAQREGLDWRGTYTAHGINAVFLEAYWNQGSPVTQSRWIDHFVISTKPIGPVVCPRQPVLFKTPGRTRSWRAQLAAGPDGDAVVWQSLPFTGGDRLTVDNKHGGFTGALVNDDQLEPQRMYVVRLSEQRDGGTWTEWGDWHQAFMTGN